MSNLPSGAFLPLEMDHKDLEIADLSQQLGHLLTPRHIDEWSEDDGTVLWWTNPISEPPYLGSPLSCGHTVEMRHYVGGEGEVKTVSTNVGGWPGYHEWWTPLPTSSQADLIESQIEVKKKARARS